MDVRATRLSEAQSLLMAETNSIGLPSVLAPRIDEVDDVDDAIGVWVIDIHAGNVRARLKERGGYHFDRLFADSDSMVSWFRSDVLQHFVFSAVARWVAVDFGRQPDLCPRQFREAFARIFQSMESTDG